MIWMVKSSTKGLLFLETRGQRTGVSYVQQLRDGLNNFFVTFIEVLKDGNGQALMVEPEVSSGDYLHGFFVGTRQALAEKGRESVTITVNEISPFVIGVLIAHFRASCRNLRFTRQHQCLPPTRSGSGQEGCWQSHSDSMSDIGIPFQTIRAGLHS